MGDGVACQKNGEGRKEGAESQKRIPVDEAAQAKRQEKRHQKVLGGISDLEVWMKDLVRNGFLNVPERAYTLFDNMARRMVDAQAPGLAGRLRAMEAIDFDSESWKSDLTESMGRLYLLMQSYRNMDGLPEEWKDEIRTQIGYPQSKDNVLAPESRWRTAGSCFTSSPVKSTISIPTSTGFTERKADFSPDT